MSFPFPRPFTCVVDYYLVAPPYCDSTVLSVENIPIRQLKDYIAFEDSDNADFNNRLLVRWCMEWNATVFGSIPFPSPSVPHPGYFAIRDMSPIRAYQIVYFDIVMTQDGEGNVVDYVYAILRQLTPLTFPCPPPPEPIPIEGGSTYGAAVEIVESQAYEITFDSHPEEQWFEINAPSPGPAWELTTNHVSGTGTSELSLYYDDPPVSESLTVATPGTAIAVSPSSTKIYLKALSLTPGGETITFEIYPTTGNSVSGSSAYTTAPTILPDVLYQDSYATYGEAKWYRVDDSAATENFEGIVYNAAATTECNVEIFWNQVTPSVSDVNWSNETVGSGTFGATPIYLKITNLTSGPGSATFRFCLALR